MSWLVPPSLVSIWHHAHRHVHALNVCGKACVHIYTVCIYEHTNLGSLVLEKRVQHASESVWCDVWVQVRGQLEVLRGACREVQGSQNFTTLLRAILALGNHLNEGTHKGNASGFTPSPYLSPCICRPSPIPLKPLPRSCPPPPSLP